jgi:hypothetical protein
VIRDRYGPENIEAAFRGEPPEISLTVEEAILCAYPHANGYWRAWLYGTLPREMIVSRLAEATAIDQVDEQRRCRLLREALSHCPFDVESVTATAAASWLAAHPDTQGLLHPSLLLYVRPPPAAPPAKPSAPATDGRSGPPTSSGEEAMPAEVVAAEPTAQATSNVEPPITSEAAAAQAYLERLYNERESTGNPPTRDADYYEWAPWVKKTWGFRVTQDMISLWRRVLLTDDEKDGGAPPSRRK